jgi:hypothetical protein
LSCAGLAMPCSTEPECALSRNALVSVSDMERSYRPNA